MSHNTPLLLTALIPRSNRTYFLFAMAGCAIIAILCGLYIVSFSFGSLTTDGTIAAFDLDAEGSIACWISIAVLLACSATAILIRRVRFGIPGSSGRSRAWLAVSAVWMLMSMDEGSSLHEGFKELMTRLMGTRIAGDGSIYWAVPYFLMLAVTGCFLLFQFRRELGAVLFLLGAGVSHAFAVVFQLEWLLRGIWPGQIVAEEAAEMVGYLFIFMAQAVHLRALANRHDALHELEVDEKRSIPTPHFVVSAGMQKHR